ESESIMGQVGALFPGLAYEIGLIAYRDKGDEFVTKAFPFTANLEAFRASLASLHAGGGGDYPEAVDAAVAEAASWQWDPSADVGKVLFLIGDAAPHDDAVAAALTAGEALARQGVAIYPVAASGISEIGELVMRTLAVRSGAEYVFLTDDSGIGSK